MKIIPIKEVLNKISPSFCAAKWNFSTIWLNDGSTASCYHCTKHVSDVEQVKINPSALHNTNHKKKMRKLMLIGVKPDECEYCWKIEDSSEDAVSDRFLLSARYSEQEILECKETGFKNDHSPHILEIAFDNLCNFACMYCDPAFSSSWQADIKKNGIYKNLVSEHALTYSHDGSKNIPFSHKNIDNPFVEAFLKWLKGDLKHSLKELKVTGGEPLLSPHFDKLIEVLKSPEYDHIQVSVNSNLGHKRETLDRLLELSRCHKRLNIYTSNESTGEIAEFIRDGENWESWKNSLCYLLDNLETDEQFSLHGITINTTITAFSIFGFKEFLEEVKQLKQRKSNKIGLYINTNSLVSPSFQAVDVLPKPILQTQTEKIKQWLNDNESSFSKKELAGIRRCLSLFDGMVLTETKNLDEKRKDLKEYITQYCLRRNKSVSKSFADHPEFVNWLEKL